MSSLKYPPNAADEAADIREDNLLVKLWTYPTATLRYVLNHCPEKYVAVLLGLGGIVRAIDRASISGKGDTMSTGQILVMAIIAGGLFGGLTYYVYAWGMSATGQWLGGRARADAFRTVLAWALIPTCLSLVLLIPKVAIFGEDLFKSQPAYDSTTYNLLDMGLGLVEFGLSIWSLVVLLKGIVLIQGFRTGRAFINVVLPGAVLLAFVGGLALLTKAF